MVRITIKKLTEYLIKNPRFQTGSILSVGPKKERSNRFVLFLSIAKAMVYHHAKRVFGRFDNKLLLTKLMICKFPGMDDIQCFTLIFHHVHTSKTVKLTAFIGFLRGQGKLSIPTVKKSRLIGSLFW